MTRVQATLAFIAAKPLLRMLRQHGHACRFQADGTIRAAYRMGPYWAIDTVQADSESVRTWLGY